MRNRTSDEAERAVLGGLLLTNDRWDAVADHITSADFGIDRHAVIFEAIKAHAEQGAPYDVVTLGDWLTQRNLLGKAGGMSYLIELARGIPSAANVRSYAEIVVQRARLSALDRISDEIKQVNTLDQAVALATECLERVADRQGDRARRVGELREDWERARDAPGWATGWRDVDAITQLRPGELIVVGARPSVGKSTLLLQLGLRLAMARVPVQLFSLEEPAAAIYERARRMAEGTPRGDAEGQLERLEQAPLWIETSTPLTIQQLFARSQRARRKRKIAVVLVDYLQLVDGEGATREQRVAAVSRGLKSLALGQELCVIAAAQLNRSSESNSRPRLADLRESGAIEQDADQAWLLHADDRITLDALELIIAKNRNGPKGDALLRHRKAHFRLESMDDLSMCTYRKQLDQQRGGHVRALRESL